MKKFISLVVAAALVLGAGSMVVAKNNSKLAEELGLESGKRL